MAVVIKGSGSIEGSSGLEMGANGATEIRGRVNVALGSSVAGDSYTSGISTATNFAPSSVPTGHRNIIINGAMQVAQRAASATAQANGFHTVDRIEIGSSNLENAADQAQVAVASGNDAYSAGFRKAFKLTNGANSADVDDQLKISYWVEAQDLACSGWDDSSSSSNITLSFWVKSSVAQTFPCVLYHSDSTKGYSFNYSATTSWTRITHTIPGAAGQAINNDNGQGILIQWVQYMGTNYTTSGHTVNTWAAYDSADRCADVTNTWINTDDATFEITGVQLEVGSVATPFEHRTYADELLRCARYYQEQQGGSDVFMSAAKAQGTTTADVGVGLVPPGNDKKALLVTRLAV